MKHKLLIVLPVLLCLGASPAALADDDRNIFERGWDGIRNIFSGGEETARMPDRRGGEDWVKATFSDDQRHLIRDYFGKHGYESGPPPHAQGKDLPPGLKKKVAQGKPLPPGWQKKLTRGKRMPDDIFAYHHRLPPELYGRLPRIDGIVDIRVEGKVIRLLEATREIVDILEL